MRSRNHEEYFPKYSWDPPGPYPTDEPGSVWFYKHQWSQDLVISDNHGFGSSRPKFSNTGDVGGDFLCYRRFYDESSSLGSGIHRFSRYLALPPEPVGRPYYEAPQWAWRDEVRNTSFPMPLPTERSELNAMSSEAISKVAPNKPAADLATFFGELREGLPHALLLGRTGRSRAQRCVNAGDEYLNVEFGWKPLVRDVQSFARAVQNSDRILTQYEAGSGKLLRRRYTFPTELSVEGPTVVQSLALPQPAIEPRLYGDNPLGYVELTTTTRVERWFSAAFTYAVPPRGTPQGYASRANRLLGTNLDPAMLWNLAPWSWALDWAGNTGTLAENLSLFNSDTLVMPWSYLMERKSIKETYRWRSYSDQVYRSHPGSHWFEQSFETVMKSRIKGTPFGFDVDWPDFSDSQLAILASLGISRGG